MITGITFGAFDLLHAGHVAMLEEAKRKCDFLMVGLHVDPTTERPDTKNKPIQSVYERWKQLNAMKAVDEIIPYETEQDIVNMLATLGIDKRFIGSDYVDRNITGQEVCQARGIEIVFIDRVHNYSSSELRERCAKPYF
jgi:glycerol-3-phosphate cytidylyltransferase